MNIFAITCISGFAVTVANKIDYWLAGAKKLTAFAITGLTKQNKFSAENDQKHV